MTAEWWVLPPLDAQYDIYASTAHGQPWGVYIDSELDEELYVGIDAAKRIASLIMIAALQAEMLNAGQTVDDVIFFGTGNVAHLDEEQTR